MTEEDKKLLHTFEGKLRQLLFLYEELKKENLSLRNEIDRKSAEIAQLECINDNDLRDTKQRLAKLVREVDKCIALLNE